MSGPGNVTRPRRRVTAHGSNAVVCAWGWCTMPGGEQVLFVVGRGRTVTLEFCAGHAHDAAEVYGGVVIPSHVDLTSPVP